MLKIVKASDPVKVEQIVLCIYSQPGLGKTSLGFTAEAPLGLDFDAGVHRACNRKDSVRVGSWAEVTEITAADLAQYRTLLVDTAGRALDSLSLDIIANNPKMGRGGALTLQGFGELKAKFAAWSKMVKASGKDIVLIAHMEEQRAGDDLVERLDVQGSSKGEIYKSSDAMGRIVLRNGRRFLDFSPREHSFGKNPCDLDIVPFNDPRVEPDTLAKVIATIKERLNQASAAEQAAADELATWKKFFDGFSSAKDFNLCLRDLKGAGDAVKFLAATRAKTLGLVWDKQAGCYTAPAPAAIAGNGGLHVVS